MTTETQKKDTTVTQAQQQTRERITNNGWTGGDGPFFVPYTRRKVTLTFTDRVVGGLPTTEKMIQPWLDVNMKDASTETKAELVKATLEAVEHRKAEVQEAIDRVWTTFGVDEKGIYLEGRCLKAAFKEVANILRETLQKQEAASKKGEAKEGKPDKSRFTALKARTAEHLHVEETRCYFERDGKVLTEADATGERPVHAMTPMGERTALKRFDYMRPGVQLAFNVRYLTGGIMNDNLLAVLLDFMQWNGVGADRSQGAGRFTFEVTDGAGMVASPVMPAPAKVLPGDIEVTKASKLPEAGK